MHTLRTVRRHNERVEPAKLRHYDANLVCDSVRVIGYRKVCRCGARSRFFASVGAARAARIQHYGSPFLP
jgi:hypothetical protein